MGIPLSVLTGKNTAAASSYSPSGPDPNGNAPGKSNVSKIAIKQQIYPSLPLSQILTKVTVHCQCWFVPGNSHTSNIPSIGYNDKSQAQADAHVADMVSRRIDELTMDYYGENNNDGNTIFGYLKNSAEAQHALHVADPNKPDFYFGASLDRGAIDPTRYGTNKGVTQSAKDRIAYLNTNFFGSPAYMKRSGRPVLMFFGIENGWDLTGFTSLAISASTKKITRVGGSDWSVNGNNKIEVGDYVQPQGSWVNANNKKMYQVTAVTANDVTVSDPSNQLVSETLSFAPKLRRHLDLAALKTYASTHGNPLFVTEYFNGIASYFNGFTSPSMDGAYSWISPTASDKDTGSLQHLRDIYTAAKLHPDRLVWGSAYKGFNDDLTNGAAGDGIGNWGTGPVRSMPQRSGQTWLDTLGIISTYYSATAQLPNLLIPTWDDWEEGSEILSGIEGGTAFATGGVFDTAPINTRILHFAVTGPLVTIDHNDIYISGDAGLTFDLVGTVPAAGITFDLTALDLDAGDYVARVQAVGKPCIINKISGAMAFTILEDTPPPPPPPPPPPFRITPEPLVFPALYKKPSVKVSRGFIDNTLASEMESGLVITRPRTSKLRRTWTVIYEFAPEQDMLDLEDFVVNKVKGASGTFKFLLPIPYPAGEEVVCRFSRSKLPVISEAGWANQEDPAMSGHSYNFALELEEV